MILDEKTVKNTTVNGVCIGALIETLLGSTTPFGSESTDEIRLAMLRIKIELANLLLLDISTSAEYHTSDLSSMRRMGIVANDYLSSLVDFINKGEVKILPVIPKHLADNIDSYGVSITTEDDVSDFMHTVYESYETEQFCSSDTIIAYSNPVTKGLFIKKD